MPHQQDHPRSSSPSATTTITVHPPSIPSPNPSTTSNSSATGTNNRRWTPLSHHGLPREPKSPTGTYISSSVSSPMSVATPSTFTSTRSGYTGGGSSSAAHFLSPVSQTSQHTAHTAYSSQHVHSPPLPQDQALAQYHNEHLCPQHQHQQQQEQQHQRHGSQSQNSPPYAAHRFDPNAPASTTTAYSHPSYTSSITLQPAPPRKPRLGRIPASPAEVDEREASGESRGIWQQPEEKPVKAGFVRKLLEKLGCASSNDGGTSAKERRRREDVVKIETIHWTEQ